VCSAQVTQPAREVARVEAVVLFPADDDHPSILDRGDHINIADLVHSFNNCAHVAIERLGVTLSRPRIVSEQNKYHKGVVPGKEYRAVLTIHTLPTRRTESGLLGGRASFSVVDSDGTPCANMEVEYAEVN